MSLRNAGLALSTALALSLGPAPGFPQATPVPQAAAPAAEQPIPVGDEPRGGSTPGSIVAGSVAAVVVVAVLIVGGTLAWAKGW